jgi:signal transduction histidine kinase
MREKFMSHWAWANRFEKLPPLVKYSLEIIFLALGYYAIARLSLFFAFEHTNASPVWPPSGIAFALILRRGFYLWPAIFLGAFFANIANFVDNLTVISWPVTTASFFIGIGNTLEAVCGAYLFRKWCTHCSPFSRAYFLLKFIIIIPIVCMISSFIGATILCVVNIVDWFMYETIWLTWWIGDVAGILTLSPLLLAGYYQSEKSLKSRGTALEAIFFLAAILAISWVVFGEHVYFFQHPYLLMPFIVWAAFRFGQIGVGCSILIILGMAIWHTVHGLGPFAEDSLNDSLLLCQLFAGVVTMTGLVLAAILNEKRQSDEDMKQYANDLKRSNEDLERFATIASHDLKEPLRIVSNYASLLGRKYKGKLDDQANEFIGYILDGANKMSDLIQDLLVYSRVGREHMGFAAVDLNAACQEVKKNLEIAIQESQAQITCEPLPSIFGDRTQIIQLFQNLISNAIKFRSEKAPVINISVKSVGSDYVFAVKDNGIGINPEYFNKIFEIFNRLHAQSEYAGTGIGLAICKKVVEAHEGKIWLESEVGQGTTFYFRIPRKRQAPAEGNAATR